MNKNCVTCGINKPFSDYSVKKQNKKDGLSFSCRGCISLKNKASYEKNSERKKQKASEYYYNNKEEILLKNKNDLARKEYASTYKQNNAKEISDYMEVYRKTNAEQIKERKKEYKKENKEKIREYENDYYKNNLNAKYAKSCRRRAQDFYKSRNLEKTSSFNDYIGCTKEEFVKHLENQFQSGMTHDNYGYGSDKWNLEHHIPLSSANTPEEIDKLNHYTNIKPMWQTENFKKGSKMPLNYICHQKTRRDQTEEEDRNNGMPFGLKAKDFTFQKETFNSDHKAFIERYEWLGALGFGVKWVFTARYNNLLAGVVMVSEPNAYQFKKEHEALLQRGACSSWAPPHLNSKLVMFSCRWMAANTSKKIFVGYSDFEAGEYGTIYQACNFDYLGKFYGSDVMRRLPNNKLVNERYFTRSSSMKRWAKEMGIEWKKDWLKPNGFQDVKKVPQIIKDYAKSKKNECPKIKVPPKGKYALLINHGHSNIEKPWVNDIKPYPKRKIEQKC